MNHNPIRIALALAILVAGCRKKPDVAQPSPLQFETKTFEKLVPGCGDHSKREQPCVTFRIKWPEVSAAPDPATKSKINSAIRARLQLRDAPAGFEAEAAAVAEEFQRFRDQFPNSGITYFVRRTAEVSFNSARLLSVEINDEDFKGGANPNARRDYVNLVPTSGQTVALADLLVRDGVAKLTALAEQQFRAGKHLEGGTSLAGAGYTFADDKFALSPTWGVDAAGLVFHYNEYEIAPQAAGATTILLPWSNIRALIKKEAGLTPVK